MNIEQANKNWTKLGENDPMWVVLTAADKRGGKWSPEEFFANGRVEIEQALSDVEAAGVTINRGTALDFGCGLGRLSQALAAQFQHVDGVDVSTSMIEQARQFNKYPDKVEYHLNVKSDLSLFPRQRFDFIYSNIVLQHIPTPHQLSYISEFMELLKPGGTAYFQAMHAYGMRALAPRWFVEAFRYLKHGGKPYIPMYGVPVADVENAIRTGGCHLQQKQSSPYPGSERRFFSDRYLAIKQQPKQ
ncbi:MAG TPA: class I SAM-dependent methyltransferase [Verrucomicrobiae bacterium]|jgi:SAM-dependent methyltransferase